MQNVLPRPLKVVVLAAGEAQVHSCQTFSEAIFILDAAQGYVHHFTGEILTQAELQRRGSGAR